MQRGIFTLLVAFVTSVFFSCGDSNSEIIRDKGLDYDTTRIALFDLDSSNKEWATPYSTPAALDQQDFRAIDSLLRQCINEYDSMIKLKLEEMYKSLPVNYHKPDYFVIDLKKYRRQYMPYIDNNYEKIVHVNCFCSERPEWKKRRIYPAKEFTNCYFSLKVDLSAKTFKAFYVNHYAG
jgi:hypothetical protein